MHDTWWHPRNKRGYSLDQIIVRVGQIGRVKQACTCSAVAVASDHIPTYLEIRVGRMVRRGNEMGHAIPERALDAFTQRLHDADLFLAKND